MNETQRTTEKTTMTKTTKTSTLSPAQKAATRSSHQTTIHASAWATRRSMALSNGKAA